MKKSNHLKKYNKLINVVKRLESVAVAFSGGIDSGFLTKVAKDILGENVVAVTAVSPTYTRKDLEDAKNIARAIGIKHIIIKTNEFKNKEFLANSRERCYWCKKELFSKLKEVATNLKLSCIVDGTTYEDKDDYRPGVRAGREHGAISPLFECKFRKEDVRVLAKSLGLSFWNKPSGTCLSSRIPFGEKITLYRIRKVEKAEEILRDFLGKDKFFRVRDHDYIARIEFNPDETICFLRKRGWHKVINKIRELGYSYITVDLEGYIPQGKR